MHGMMSYTCVCRPLITVISAKPMDSSGSIPLPDISEMKTDEKPMKVKYCYPENMCVFSYSICD